MLLLPRIAQGVKVGQPEADDVHAAVAEVSRTVRGLLVAADSSEVVTRHEVGELLRHAKGAPRTYGKHVVEEVAADVGVGARVLYQYIAVAEAWSATSIHRELQKRNRVGQALSWSHFLVLTRVVSLGRPKPIRWPSEPQDSPGLAPVTHRSVRDNLRT